MQIFTYIYYLLLNDKFGIVLVFVLFERFFFSLFKHILVRFCMFVLIKFLFTFLFGDLANSCI